MLFFSEKDNKLSVSEEIRGFFKKHPFLKFNLNFTDNFQFGFVFPTLTPVSSESNRRYIRFPLTLQARRHSLHEQINPILIRQISIGGCLVDWDENVKVGDKFRVEILLQNGNWLPVTCKVLYRMPENALGVKFQDITKFEQELLAKLIEKSLAKRGLPYENAFATPINFKKKSEENEPNEISNYEPQEILT